MTVDHKLYIKINSDNTIKSVQIVNTPQLVNSTSFLFLFSDIGTIENDINIFLSNYSDYMVVNNAVVRYNNVATNRIIPRGEIDLGIGSAISNLNKLVEVGV
jgi:hypothetical protein